MLRASHQAYLALRIAGAIYLLWLGVQSLRSRGRSTGLSLSAPANRSLLGTVYLAGITTDRRNPKFGVFVATLLPGFVPRGSSAGAVSVPPPKPTARTKV